MRMVYRAVCRAIYWLVAISLLSGVVGFADMTVHPDPAEGVLLGLVDAVVRLVSAMGGLLLLPPVIDRVWAGGFFVGHSVYRAFGVLFLLPIIVAVGIFMALVVFADVPIPPLPLADEIRQIVTVIAYVLLGLMFFPFCTKRIRKTTRDNAPKAH